jgi:hypothetical protein
MSEMLSLTAPLRDLHEFLKPYRHGSDGELDEAIHVACKKVVTIIAVAEEYERRVQELFLDSLQPIKRQEKSMNKVRLHISRANHKALNHVLPLGPAQDVSQFGPNVVVVDFGAAKRVKAPFMPDDGGHAA